MWNSVDSSCIAPRNALVACHVVGTEVQGKAFMEKMYPEMKMELITR